MYRFKLSTLPEEFGSLPSSIKSITLFIFLYSLSWGLAAPFQAIYFNSVLGGYTATALAVGFLYFFVAIFSVLVGELSEAVHPKKILLWTLLFYLPLGPLILTLDNLTEFFIFKIYHAILATLLWTTCYIYVRKHSPAQKFAESIGLFNAGEGLSMVVGSVLGGALAFWYQDIRILFLIMPLFILFTIVYNFFLPNHTPISDSADRGEVKIIFNFTRIKNDILDFFRTEKLPFFALVSFLFMAARFSLALLLPLFSESLNANYLQIGIIYMLSAVPILFQAPFSILADKYGKRRAMRAGFLISAVIFFALIFTDSLFMLGILAFLLSVSFSISMPAIEGELTKLMPGEKRGVFGGIADAIMNFGAAFGIFVIGPISDAFGLKSAFLVGFSIMAILLTVFYIKNHTEKVSKQSRNVILRAK